MKNISDLIEQYLKEIIRSSDGGLIELQRTELAELFQCVPSQINYVISTRFTVEKGYVVESKRGGGGYIRIKKIEFVDGDNWVQSILPNGTLTQKEAEGLIHRLHEGKLITQREALIMQAVMNREVLTLELPLRDQIRAQIFRAMILAVLRRLEGES